MLLAIHHLGCLLVACLLLLVAACCLLACSLLELIADCLSVAFLLVD